MSEWNSSFLQFLGWCLDRFYSAVQKYLCMCINVYLIIILYLCVNVCFIVLRGLFFTIDRQIQYPKVTQGIYCFLRLINHLWVILKPKHILDCFFFFLRLNIALTILLESNDFSTYNAYYLTYMWGWKEMDSYLSSGLFPRKWMSRTHLGFELDSPIYHSEPLFITLIAHPPPLNIVIL